ncbi:MAG: sulfhydrogenase subunit delta [Gammaproteobacteria bacterium]|nr:sulfhydrogenase subunit delta [Gammaproteobacteria bacterium]
MLEKQHKPRISIHKFSSCDGCQLAFLNLGPELLRLAQRVDIVHFAEAGPVAPDADVDVAFIEGSIAHPEDIERIRRIRERSRYLVAIGACATSGGVQALRNVARSEAWLAGVYATPAYIEELVDATPIAAHVKVDCELWGCPVTSRQVLTAVSTLLHGVSPRDDADKVCLECKRRQTVCTLVTRAVPCLGPVTRAGCGALCPSFGRDCYGCFGPAENPNVAALGRRFAGLGLVPEAIAQRFQSISNGAPVFRAAAAAIREGAP